MGLMDRVREMFVGERPKTVEDISIRDLDSETLRLEEEEARLIKRITRLEEDKKTLFQEGAHKASQQEKLVYVRRIRQVDNDARIVNQRLSGLSKKLTFLQNLRWLKENQKELEREGTWSTLVNMDPDRLEQWVVETRARQRETDHVVDDLNRRISPEDALHDLSGLEPEDQALLAAMERAGESGEVEQGLKEFDQLLKKSETSTE